MFLIIQRLRKGPLRTSESKNIPVTSDNQSADFAESDSLRFNIFPKYDSLRLLDAHLIFEPLLSSLGVMPQQMVNPNSGIYFTSHTNLFIYIRKTLYHSCFIDCMI